MICGTLSRISFFLAATVPPTDAGLAENRPIELPLVVLTGPREHGQAMRRRPAAAGGNPHHGTRHLRRDGQVLANLRPPDRSTHERDPQGRVLRQPPIRDLAPQPGS